MSDDRRTYRDALACQDVVELVTDYLDGSLEPQDRLLFEEHLAFCDWCATYLEQFRETIRLTGTLREKDVAPPIRDELVRMFRDWRQST
jgi:anti-sigma factor RsiW